MDLHSGTKEIPYVRGLTAPISVKTQHHSKL